MKKMKYLLVALLVCCCFMLTACGGGQLDVKAQANIGAEASYTATTATAATDFINAETSETEVDAYRMTIEMTTMGTISMNAIVANTQDGLQMAMKMTQTDLTGKTATGTMYYVGDAIYGMFDQATATAMGYPSTNMKVVIPAEADVAETEFGMIEQYNMASILSNMENELSAPGVTVTTSVEGDFTRFKVVTEIDGAVFGGEDSTSTTYLVFKNNQLVSAQMETNVFGIIKVVIEAFDGEIQFPDFTGFAEVAWEDYVQDFE